MAGNASMRSLNTIFKTASGSGCRSLVKQIMKRSNSNISKTAVLESSFGSSRSRLMSTVTVQNMMKSVGPKSMQKLKIAEMQRCVAAISLLTKSTSSCLVMSSSDGEMLEGTEDGDDVCSQGKQHCRYT